MSKIAILGQEWPLAVPQDAAAQLLAATGLSVGEIAGHLGEASSPAQIAAALLPFIDGEKPAVADLARLIELDQQDDRYGVIDQVRDQLAALTAPAPAATPAKGGKA